MKIKWKRLKRKTCRKVTINQNFPAQLFFTASYALRETAFCYFSNLNFNGSVAPLARCVVSCRTAFKWCEFDPRDVQQLFGTPCSKVSLR